MYNNRLFLIFLLYCKIKFKISYILSILSNTLLSAPIQFKQTNKSFPFEY